MDSKVEENYKRLREELNERLNNDKRLTEILDKISKGTATFKDSARYSQIVADHMGDVISKNIGKITVPLGKEMVCKKLLKDNIERVDTVFGKVQVSVDEKMGIHLNPVTPPYPTERVNAIAHSLEDPNADDEKVARRGRSSGNVVAARHDENVKANAAWREKAGFDCYLVRDAGGGCCPWCAAIAGRYKYAEAPDDVFRRHDHCTCTTTYECGRMRQDVWSKRTWQADPKDVEARIAASDAATATRLTPEQAKAIDEQSKATQLNAEQAEALQNRILAVPNDSESALKYDFVEAKSIEEAQLYAKQFCNDGFMAKNFKGEVDFKGISLDNANAINEALTDVYNKVDLDKISGIKVVSPSSALGKKAFKDGADAVFSYDPIQHGIYVNKDVLKNEKTFAEYVKRSEDSWNTVMNNIDKLSGSQKELALVYQNAGRSLVDGNTVEGMFTHELGHHAQWTLLDAKTNNAVGSRMSEFAPKISGYANASKSEYLAESFSAYMKGERNLLDPEYVKFLDEKAIDNGMKSGIIEEEVAIPSDKVNNFFLKPKAKHAEEFFSVGYTKDDGEILSKHLREGFDYSKAVDKRTGDDGSERFSVFMDLGVDKKRRFRIVWQKDTPNSKPRLITGHREDD